MEDILVGPETETNNNPQEEEEFVTSHPEYQCYKLQVFYVLSSNDKLPMGRNKMKPQRESKFCQAMLHF